MTILTSADKLDLLANGTDGDDTQPPRPRVYDRERLAALICDDVADGMLVSVAAPLHGVPPRRFREWCEDAPETIGVAYVRAKRLRAHALSDGVIGLVDDIREATGRAPLFSAPTRRTTGLVIAEAPRASVSLAPSKEELAARLKGIEMEKNFITEMMERDAPQEYRAQAAASPQQLTVRVVYDEPKMLASDTSRDRQSSVTDVDYEVLSDDSA